MIFHLFRAMITLNKKGVFEMSQQKPAFSTAATARHILVCLLLFLAGDLLSSLAFDLLFAVARPPAPWLYQLPRALGALALTWALFR